MEKGVRVGGELLKDVKFADDQGMVAQTEKWKHSSDSERWPKWKRDYKQ